MRSLWIALGLLVAAGSASADSVAEIISRASEVNATYRIAVAEYNLATRRYESDSETAETPDEVVSAELSRITSLSTLGNSLKSYYNGVIDAVFDIGVALLNLQAAETNQAIAEADLAYARARHESGVISAADLTSAELDYREQSDDLSGAQFDEREARAALQSVTGLDWSTDLLPGDPGPAEAATPPDWTAADLAYERAVLNQIRAESAADNPSGTVSAFDQESADIELLSAELEVQRSREAAEQSYRSTVRALESGRISLDIQRERLALERQLVEVAELRFDRGLITESQRNAQLVKPLVAEARYLDALRRYIKDIVAQHLHLGLSLDGI